MSKLLIATSIHQRYQLTKIVLDYYAEIQKSMFLGTRVHSVELLAVGSTNQAKIIAENSGWNYVNFPNNPLSFKMNALFVHARKFNPDGVLLINSDNLLDANLIFYYLNNFWAETPYLAGLKDIYFYSPAKNETIYFEGYKEKVQSTGAGRFFSRTVLDKMNWNLWGNERINKSMDSACSRRLKKSGISEQVFTMHDAHGVCVDIKTDENITPYSRIELAYKTNIADNGILLRAFPEQMVQINNLNKTVIANERSK